MVQLSEPQQKRISVQTMMSGQDKKPTGKGYIAPQNSIHSRTDTIGTVEPAKTTMVQQHTYGQNCPNCENLARNFFYLESLVRNNMPKDSKCELCRSSLKYLQYVNRSIMQVFGNHDTIVQAAKAFATKVPHPHKYSVNTPKRSTGGALPVALKSNKSLKTLKQDKSNKSLMTKSNKSLMTKSNKSLKTKSNKSMKTAKKSKIPSKSKATKPKAGGKMALKQKFKKKVGSYNKLLKKIVRSPTQYGNLLALRNKALAKAKRPKIKPTSINWSLIKKNLPRPKVASAK